MTGDTLTAGRELDALVAEKVFGWKRQAWTTEYTSVGDLLTPPGEDDSVTRRVPHYSTDIAPAWLVVERMRDAYDMSCTIATNECAHTQNGVKFYEGYQGLGYNIFDSARHIGFEAVEDTVPLAICKAALAVAAAPLNATEKGK